MRRFPLDVLSQHSTTHLKFGNIITLVACAAFAIALSAATPTPSFASDTSGRSGLEGAAEALRNELEPSMLTFEKYQEKLGTESSVNIENARVQGLQDVMYTGQAETPTITLKLGSTTLNAGEDFDVELSGDNVNPGTVTVAITGKGAYTGTIETSFTILPGDLSSATVDVIPDQEATGEEICPTPTVKIDGEELTLNEDYTVEYLDNIEPGTATILIEGIGNCEGETHISFEIVEASEESDQSTSVLSSIPVIAAILSAAAIVALAAIAVVVLRRRKNKRTSF